MKLPQFVLALLPLSNVYHAPTKQVTKKSIAIVGGGSAGLEALKNILDLPSSVRDGWDIHVYESRDDIGGLWIPQPVPPPFPTPPLTGLYPDLHTNTIVNAMTYSGTPFPPETHLFPHHTHILAYLHNYAKTHNLRAYIHLNHTVLQTSWIGTPTEGAWSIDVQKRGAAVENITQTFDHLILATGHSAIPHIPVWDGVEEWLVGSGPGSMSLYKREILHSQWYRGPERYAGRTVLVLGSGPSGRDGVSQILTTARKVYHSLSDSAPSGPPAAIRKTRISHFTREGIVFEDGSFLGDVDSVYLGTGYEIQYPYLEATGLVRVNPKGRAGDPSYKGLVSTNRYLAPLFKHTVSLSAAFPPTALFVIGLPVYVAYRFSDSAQSVLTAHLIANSSILPPREELLADLEKQEKELSKRAPHFTLEKNGHYQVAWDGQSEDYQDSLIDWLRERGAIPQGPKFVEKWRRDSHENIAVLRRAWARVRELGTEDEWVHGVKGEDGYAVVVARLGEWEKKLEQEETKLD